MAALITDKFTETTNGTRPDPTTVTSTRSAAATTLQCAALTGWPTATAVHFATYRTNAQGEKVAGSQCDWKGIVSGNQITSLTLKAGTDVGNAIGDTVVCMPTAAWADDVVEGIMVEHKQTGGHGVVTATSLTTTSSVTAGNGLTVTTGTVSLPSASINQSALPLGAVVQVVNTAYAAVATGTTTIPLDDTIPQITEGTEFMTQAITPKSSSNILVIEITALLSNSVTANISGALFQDATANALAANSHTIAGNTYTTPLTLSYSMAAGTTSATTFRFRAGPSSASTTTFNGSGGSRLFGAISKSIIKITEYKA